MNAGVTIPYIVFVKGPDFSLLLFFPHLKKK